jgi:hypothetical protein
MSDQPQGQPQPRDIYFEIDYADPAARLAADLARAEWRKRHEEVMFDLEQRRRAEAAERWW